MTDRSGEIDMEALFAEHGRISTFSVPENCVEVAPMPDGASVAIRNHNRPHQGWIILDRAGFADLITRCKSGALDALLA